jgi:hypothetical protein
MRRLMAALNMMRGKKPPRSAGTVEALRSSWVRARQSGVFDLSVQLGDTVQKGRQLGVLRDPFGENRRPVRSPCAGVVVGVTTNPLVHRGDAMVHLARLDQPAGATSPR